jgi:hypothetical protein
MLRAPVLHLFDALWCRTHSVAREVRYASRPGVASIRCTLVPYTRSGRKNEIPIEVLHLFDALWCRIHSFTVTYWTAMIYGMVSGNPPRRVFDLTTSPLIFHNLLCYERK